MKKRTEILMCPGDLQYPEGYGKINEWMDERHSVGSFMVKWVYRKVIKLVSFFGADIKLIPFQKEYPDMFFVRNAGLILPGEKRRVILSSFKHKERQGERDFYRKWFEENGFEVIDLPVGVIFEGGGEAIWYKNTLFFGHGFRAPINTTNHIRYALYKANLEANVVPLKLNDERFYHLDTAFMPIYGDGETTEDVLVYAPIAFDIEALKTIAALSIKRIEVSEEDACVFGCNFLAIGNNIIMAKGTKNLAYKLQNFYGFNVYEVDMAEIKKGGGSVYCMTLNIS